MIRHVPAVTTSIAPFTTVQTVGVVEVKVTGYEMPALLVASKVCGVLTVVIAIGGVKVMVCGSLVIVILRTTLLAAAVVVSPAWLAVIEQVPADTTVRVVPLMRQAADVVAKLTGYEGPAELVATRVCGVDESVTAVGGVKVMVCGSLVIEIDLEMLLAAR